MSYGSASAKVYLTSAYFTAAMTPSEFRRAFGRLPKPSNDLNHALPADQHEKEEDLKLSRRKGFNAFLGASPEDLGISVQRVRNL